ncbi:3359_t:CDS:1, partial [Paraglomus occultum]
MTVAIGSPAKKAIDSIELESIESIKFQMKSGNQTLNRRDEVPQCPDNRFHILMNSFCLTEDKIRSVCASNESPGTIANDVDCPEKTTCVDFIKNEDQSPYAYCMDSGSTMRWSNGHNDSVVCTYPFTLADAYGSITLGVTVYDVNRNTIQVDAIYYDVGESFQSKYNTHNLSLIVDYKS